MTKAVNVINGTKKCGLCHTAMPVSLFTTDSKSTTGLSSTCLPCNSKKGKKWRRENPEVTKAKARRADRIRQQYRRHLALIKTARLRARKLGVAFSVSHAKVRDAIYIHGRCAVTGIPFDTMTPGKIWNSPSIDRIKYGGDYVDENIRIVIKAFNIMRSNWGEDKILKVAAGISRQQYEG